MTMIRTFQEHAVRSVVALDGRWDFVTAPERRDQGRLPTRYTRTISVPSAWETLPGLVNYRGKAWFRTWVAAFDEDALRLVFGGVSHTGTVFVDGRKVGSHCDAFTPWTVLVPGLSEGEHELVIEVDNSFGPHSALHIPNDYYTYGGLTRPVELQYVPDIHLEQVSAVPRRTRSGWELDLRVRVRNVGRQAGRRQVVVDCAGKSFELGSVTLKGGVLREVRRTLSGFKVEEWSSESPQLYSVDVDLMDGEDVVDDLADRVGFREVKVRGRQLLLNGRPLRLRGFNRHEDHGQFGNSLPLEAMVQDLELMRDMGCNFVRTCHYPNDRRFLDLCDEMGFYVWEESHARTVDFKHPRFREQIENSTREMVTWHANHPSIIMWGCLNECDSFTPGGRTEHARVLRLLRKLDSTRPVTFASNRAEHDLCLGLVDIVSWNRYDGWYGGEPKDVAPRLKQILKWLHSPKSHGGRNKPVILSEFGGAAVYGVHDAARRQKWTEEYQGDVLDESLRVYLNHPDVVGAAIWQFCDCRITDEGRFWGSRPRCQNNKGVVDEFRRRKMAYDIVKRRMIEARKRD
jgi:beta-glucuronidase